MFRVPQAKSSLSSASGLEGETAKCSPEAHTGHQGNSFLSPGLLSPHDAWFPKALWSLLGCLFFCLVSHQQHNLGRPAPLGTAKNLMAVP